MSIAVETKRCGVCKIELALTSFNKNRRTGDGFQWRCRDCQRVERRKNYLANREGELAQNRAWTEENRERRRELQRLDYQRHREERLSKMRVYSARESPKIVARVARWRQENLVGNPERRKQYQATQRAWRSRFPEKMAAANARRRVATRDGYTSDEWEALKELHGNRCLCCGATGVRLEPDHVKPISKDGPNTIDNIQPLCGPCNRRKSDKEVDYR